MKAAAATVKDAACGTEAIDGVTHDTVEASYEVPAYKTCLLYTSDAADE